MKLNSAGGTKLLRIMRLTAILLLGFGLSVSARTVSQTVTFSAKNVPLQTAFAAVEKQTGYVVFCSFELLEKAELVSVVAENEPLENFLKRILREQGLDFVIEEKTISVKKVVEDAELKSPPVFSPSLTAPPVTGIVRGPDGQPLAGVNVVVKGTKRGTTTNADGTFNIEAKEGEVLVISSIGYAEKLVAIGNDPVKVVELTVSESKLDEVQIIAYGETSKRFNTGNVVSVKSDVIQRQPVNNPLYALQGRVAGLQITPTSGLAGGPVNISIRGRNTIRSAEIGLEGSAEPLIVVDGLPITNNIPGLDGAELGLRQFSSLNFLNPNEIESIEVLKDADATSIYGSRGANGVILISTRKGNGGKTTIDINAQSGYAQVPKKIKLLNTQEYLTLRREAYALAGIDIQTTTTRLSTADVKLWDSTRETDWQNTLIGKTARYTDMQATITGGGPLINYSLGGNYHKETTVFPGDFHDTKASIHFSFSTKSRSNKLRTLISASFLSNNNNYPGIDFTKTATSLPPNAPSIYDTNGDLNWELLPNGNKSWNNPFASLLQSYNSSIKNLLASGMISYEVINSLTLKVQFAYNDIHGNSIKRISAISALPPEVTDRTAAATFNNNSTSNISLEPQLHYRKSVKKFLLNALVGGSLQSNGSSNQNISGYGFATDALIENLQAATLVTGARSRLQYKYNAVFSRVNINLDNKYILNASVRRDGSSRFGPGNQFGNFASIGAAWLFQSENIIKNAIPILSFGKLRLSYGSSGNDGIGDYGYLDKYLAINDVLPYQGVRGYRTSGLFNAYYAWEVTKKLELGLETGFFNDKILFSISAYRNRSSSQLLNFSFPSMAGPGNPLYNLPALIQNQGIEITLESVNIKAKYFTWNTAINISQNNNKLVKFPGLAESIYYSAFTVGEPYYGVLRLYKSAGVDPVTGQYQFEDESGKLTLTPEDGSSLDGGRYLRIRTDPQYYGGISNRLAYKGVALDFFFQFSKTKAINPFAGLETNAGFLGNLPEEFNNRWHEPGDNATYQKLVANFNPDLREASSRFTSSDYLVVDASFVRLKNASVSYDFQAPWKTRLGLTQLRLYVQGQNLFTWASYKGFDPETNSINTLPPLRAVTFGIQLTL